MAQGVTQNTQVVTQAVSHMTQAAVTSAKSNLGIASPSRVFHDMGADSALGFANGVGSGHGRAGGAGASLGEIAAAGLKEGLATGWVAAGEIIKYHHRGHWMSDRPYMMPFDTWLLDQQMVGGFGSGVQAAADGTLPIAQDRGLQVGSVWARSVVTGVDSVLHSGDFTSLAVPAIGSALAKTALGQRGDLGPAGSGAEIYNATQGNGGLVTMGSSQPVQVQVTNHTYLDGQLVDTKIEKKLVKHTLDMVNLVGQQRG